ncbi:MAG: signal recognition particle-docking protein FtsY [Piscirickettsiaceae bacterium]|nr:signal recognition particle-docking protein FtsY [Piscirickettsiaceae bacterium]
MFSFLRKKTKPLENTEQAEEQQVQVVDKHNDTSLTAQTEPEKQTANLFSRLKQRLNRTSTKLTEGFADLILGKKAIDDELLEELETQLITADLGIDATQTIINDLTQRVARKQLGDSDALFTALRDDMVAILQPSCQPLVIPKQQSPYVILMVGINGVGKTTTIGKLAKQFQQQGKSVMLAAGDTFRAAAVEQLQVWGERNNIAVISQHNGADSASVIFDALQAAKARNIDILIADTAGRLHTQSNLMEELKKVRRVMGKLDSNAPHEVMLVLDAGTGQNALSQAVQFEQAVGVTGITLTKLDGTAKGGIIFAIAKKTGLPIRYIGVGETIDDLRPFQADEFVDALLGRED